MVTKAPKSMRRATLPSYTRPTSTSAVMSSMRRCASRPAAPDTEATFTVPSLSMSMVVPVSSVIWRMTAPPLPMTSRIFSASILIVMIEGAHSDLIERDAHDLRRDAFDLDVHLQRRDAILRTGDLEIHVAEMILVAQDVGQHL